MPASQPDDERWDAVGTVPVGHYDGEVAAPLVCRPFGTWPSDISVSTVLDNTSIVDGPRSDGHRPYWAEVRFDQGGRCGVWTLHDGTPTELTGPDEDVRSTVYEYGGGAWNVDSGIFAYVDHRSQSVKVREDGITRTLATMPPGIRVGDLSVSASHRSIVAVRERWRDEESDPEHAVIRLPLDEPGPIVIDDAHTVLSGRDFYAAPRLCDTGELCWVEWDHPEMAWSRTRILTGPIGDPEGAATLVAGRDDESALHPTWARDGDGAWTLLFCSDRSGFWNLYRWDGSRVLALAPMDADLIGAPWALGGQPFAPRADGSIVCAWYADGSHVLGTLMPDGRRVAWRECAQVGRIAAGPDWVAVEAAFVDEPGGVLVGATGPGVTSEPAWRRGSRTVEAVLPPEAISRPRPMTWNGDAGPVHGWYYPPASATHCGPQGDRPPLIVLIHGGPTSMAHSSFALDRQIWTNRGFALLDVNYSGSTGFGREYRGRLDARWGELDVSDCVRGAQEVGAAGLADPDAVMIRGASAGGFTALRAAASSETFAGVVSIYGVTDVASMARDTHKLESRYIRRLVGDRLENASASPLGSTGLGAIRCPVLILHGSEDRVVPIDQARRLAESLGERRVPCELVVFDGEAHGFRDPRTLHRSFTEELAFYQRLLS